MKNLTISSKKGDSKLLSVWWFAVLVFIAVGIVIGVMIFFSGKLDVRLLEAEALANRVADCLSENGYISREFLADKSKIFDLCSLNGDILNKSGNYFLKISLADASTKKESSPAAVFGNAAFEADCKIGAGMLEARYYPRCVTKQFYLLDKDNKRIIMNITAGANQEYKPK